MTARTLERAIPPQLAALLPEALRNELEAMAHLSDDALLAIAYRTAPSGRQGRIEELLDLEVPTPEQQAELTTLGEKADVLMVRKAHAFVLLKDRGHPLPAVDQLPVPTA